MALYLLNISVDSADPYPDHIPEDLSFNDLESIAEIVVETVLGYENAIKEYDDPDSEEHNSQGSSKIDLLAYQDYDYNQHQTPPLEKKHLFIDSHDRPCNGYQEIDGPPPRM